MLKRKVNVGVVGCGGICKATYMDNMVNKFEVINVVGCYDLMESRMDYMVNKYGIKKYASLEEICSDPDIEVICNLTYPKSHVLVTKTALEHGKHVYCEKMMAPTFEDAKMLHDLAEEKGLVYTTAPDTFLGAWEQSARFYLDQGVIGKPVTIHAQVTSRYQPDTPFFNIDHSSPKHYFFPLDFGGGFPFDLGGYYIHEMINLFGSVKRLCGFGGNIDPVRTFTNPKHPRYGETVEINTPTTLLCTLEFENGVLGTFHISSDSFRSQDFTVTGTDGTLKLGDPNMFNSPLMLTRPGANPPVEWVRPGEQPKMAGAAAQAADDDIQTLGEWTPAQEVQLPLLHPFYDSLRGVGLCDMCYALINGRRPRCHNDIGLHAIEIIHGIQESCKTGKFYEMTTRCPRPEAVPMSSACKTGQEAALDN